jgi:hypothetical protein
MDKYLKEVKAGLIREIRPRSLKMESKQTPKEVESGIWISQNEVNKRNSIGKWIQEEEEEEDRIEAGRILKEEQEKKFGK